MLAAFGRRFSWIWGLPSVFPGSEILPPVRAAPDLRSSGFICGSEGSRVHLRLDQAVGGAGGCGWACTGAGGTFF